MRERETGVRGDGADGGVRPEDGRKEGRVEDLEEGWRGVGRVEEGGEGGIAEEGAVFAEDGEGGGVIELDEGNRSQPRPRKDRC